MELIIVMSIFSLITLVILANHSRFDSHVLLGSLAYNIALSVREAQVYGLSVRQNNTSFQVGYGLHIESANNKQYILFADTNSNKQYDSGTDTIVKQYTLGKNHTLSNFCGTKADGTMHCSNGSTATQITKLDVVFLRPDPDANISSEIPNTPYSSAQIYVSSSGGATRSLTVASTGQISVNQGQ